MENQTGLNTSNGMFWKPRRVRSRKQLARLITVKMYAKANHLSLEGVKYQLKHGKIWATKIGSRVWIDPNPEEEQS